MFFFPSLGVINRGDSFRRRRSRSNSLAPTSPMSYQAPAEAPTRNGPVDSYRVYMLGAPEVGKNALISQFQTSECINAYEGPGKYTTIIDLFIPFSIFCDINCCTTYPSVHVFDQPERGSSNSQRTKRIHMFQPPDMQHLIM